MPSYAYPSPRSDPPGMTVDIAYVDGPRLARTATAPDIAHAIRQGADRLYDSLDDPREGTGKGLVIRGEGAHGGHPHDPCAHRHPRGRLLAMQDAGAGGDHQGYGAGPARGLARNSPAFRPGAV